MCSSRRYRINWLILTSGSVRKALITGAASGIGRATAERLASEGASVFLVDLAKEGLEESARRCAAQGAAVESAPCDVSREEQVNDAVARCLDRFGRLDVLVNVAGILLLAHTHETTLAQWQKILDVNLTGTFLFCRAALPHLLASHGNIVNTSSTSAINAIVCLSTRSTAALVNCRSNCTRQPRFGNAVESQTPPASVVRSSCWSVLMSSIRVSLLQ